MKGPLQPANVAGSATDTVQRVQILDASGNLSLVTAGGDTVGNTALGAIALYLLRGDAGGAFDRARTVEALADAGARGIAASGLIGYNGATWDKLRVATVFKSFASTAITAGTGATIWTPTAGKKFRVMGWAISSSVAGVIILGDNLAATVIARSPAVAAAGFFQLGAGDMGNGILSAAANNVLKVDGPTGNVAGMVWGVEE